MLRLRAVLGLGQLALRRRLGDDGPQAGYFPFYLSVILGAASLAGLVQALRAPPTEPS